MNPKTVLAVVLIGLAAIAFAYQGIDYTTRGHEMNIGPMHMSTEQSHHIPLPPVLGAIALVGGIALLLLDRRNVGRPATP
jgi:hypothetical protein